MRQPSSSITCFVYRMALVAIALMVTGCAFNSPKYPPAPAAAATPDYNYIVGAGDSLNIIVWRNPELSMTVPVRPDGKVATPLVDEIVAQGKTAVQIARDVELALAKFVRDPIVTVIVTGFIGPYSEQIRVVGEASKPQFLAYKPGDFYLPHTDNFNKSGVATTLAKRKVTAVIFLNSEAVAPGRDTYSGGSLTFYGLIDEPRWRDCGFSLVGEAGLLIAFRADILHEVPPVTHGERHTIVTWFF